MVAVIEIKSQDGIKSRYSATDAQAQLDKDLVRLVASRQHCERPLTGFLVHAGAHRQTRARLEDGQVRFVYEMWQWNFPKTEEEGLVYKLAEVAVRNWNRVSL